MYLYCLFNRLSIILIKDSNRPLLDILIKDSNRPLLDIHNLILALCFYIFFYKSYFPYGGENGTVPCKSNGMVKEFEF
jgi:hypothetical protein